MRSAVQMTALSGNKLAPVPQARGASIERRAKDRVATVYRVALASTDTDAGLCRVHNISDYGMMLASKLVMEEGQRITVSLADTLTISGVIAWVDETRVGVEFAEAIDSAALLQSLGSNRRDGGLRAPRLVTDTIAVTWSDVGTEIVGVLNISQHGMKIAHSGRFQAGLSLNIVLENGIVCRGVVRWSEGSLAGIMLLEPIAHQQLGRASDL